jgi:hypothetical protein
VTVTRCAKVAVALFHNMICYYHPDKPAVGLCKYCQRGLCADCTALIDDSLACHDRHETQVHEMTLLMQKNILQSRRVGSDYVRNTIFYGVVGILFTAFGASQLRWLGLQAVVYLVIGLALLWAALANYLESRKYK